MSTPAIPVVERVITGEELYAMGDIGRAELIDGRIVRMSPTSKKHGSLENRFAQALNGFVYPRRLGEVLLGEVGLYIRRNPDRIRAADLVFISKERLARDQSPVYLGVAPELVIEIISPGDRWDDIRQKIEDFFSIGVERVWICEPELQDVLIYRSPTEFSKVGIGEVIKGEGILEGFELAVAELFQE